MANTLFMLLASTAGYHVFKEHLRDGFMSYHIEVSVAYSLL